MPRFLRIVLPALLACGVTALVLFIRDHQRVQEARQLRDANNRLRFEQGLRRHAAADAPKTLDPAEKVAAASGRAITAAAPAPEQPAPALEDYRYEGTATPAAALHTLAWHGDRGDSEAVAAMLVFDERARTRAQQYFDSLPPEVRRAAGDLDQLAATEVTAGIIRMPFPRAVMLDRAHAEPTANSDRVTMVLSGSTRERMEFQRTPDGWKYVITEAMVEAFLRNQRAALP